MIYNGAEASFIGTRVIELCRLNEIQFTELDEKDGVLADGRTIPLNHAYDLTVTLGPKKIAETFNS